VAACHAHDDHRRRTLDRIVVDLYLDGIQRHLGQAQNRLQVALVSGRELHRSGGVSRLGGAKAEKQAGNHKREDQYEAIFHG